MVWIGAKSWVSGRESQLESLRRLPTTPGMRESVFLTKCNLLVNLFNQRSRFLIAYYLGSICLLGSAIAVPGRIKMSVLFQLALVALVLMSFVMVIGVPVAYASPQNWEQSKKLIFLGSGLWVALVLVVGTLNYFVV
jgi:photosystem II PsbZ protein